MNKLKLIERGNKESLGKYFLQKAVDFAFDGSFGKSYEFAKEGLDILTCDCGMWRKRYENSDKTLFSDLLVNTSEYLEYYFVKAFILSFEDDVKDIYVGLDSIEKYLNKRQNEYGFYVKGKILLSLEKPAEAYEVFLRAMEFDKNPRLLYRIGRIKEEHFTKNGLKYLSDSFIMNSSSACCVRILKKYMEKRAIDLSKEKKETNKLILSFVGSDDEWRFYNLFEEFLNNEYLPDDLPFMADVETLPIVNNFVKFLRENAMIFKVDFEDHDEYEDYENDDNSYSDYGTSYDKYGGYNGYSDDVIDDAFEGDPMNTWNID